MIPNSTEDDIAGVNIRSSWPTFTLHYTTHYTHLFECMPTEINSLYIHLYTHTIKGSLDWHALTYTGT